jgi:hypothetical protein
MNYKDLQNIAFLSQEILTESATKEHNALDRWPYTSPYLQESTEVYDEEYRKLPVGKMMWKAVNRTEREADARVDRENAVNDPYGHLSFDRAAEEQEKAEKNKERNYKMIRVADTHSKKEAKAKSKLKTEQVDLYDIILSHLLDEGYADTVENAESIMVNMSEDWRESICEEYDIYEERAPGVKPYGGGKEVGDKMRAGYGIKITPKPLSGKKGDASGYGAPEKFKKPDDNIENPGTTVPAPKKGGYGRISPVIPYGIGANATPTRSNVSTITRQNLNTATSRMLPPEDKKKLSREIIRKPKNEEYDLYDVILSHLLDEGYVETVENAEAIMVNMSEDWRESIMEENVSKKQQKKDAKTREKWYGEKSIERGTDRFSQLQKKAIESGKTKLF